MAVARYYDHDRGEWVVMAQGVPGPKGDPGGKGDPGDPGPPGVSTWEGITDKPAAFPPESHTHPEYAKTTEVEARTPEVRIVSSPEMATSPGVLYVVMEG